MKTLRAGSLYFAIFVSFIITVLLSVIIMYAWYSNSYIDKQVLRDQVESNASGGIILALMDSALLTTKNSDTVYLFGREDETSRVLIRKSIWGVYKIISSCASYKDCQVTKIALTGSDLASGEPIALYFADHNRYLSVCGHTVLTGICYFPKLGARRAFIEGQSSGSGTLVNGEIKTSNATLPGLNAEFLNSNEAFLRDTLPEIDNILYFDRIRGIDSLENSFSSPTLTLISKDPIVLNNVLLKGNIRIISAKAIYLTENARAENIIIFAPSIYFNMGFKGSLQAFAQDTLISGEGCDFSFPSCLGIINGNINGVYLELKQKTNLEGCIFIYQDGKAVNSPFLKIEKDVTIHGQVYCPGNIEIKGIIQGSLYCDGFILRTSSAFYENHLLDVTIDRPALSEFFAGSFLIPNYRYGKEIKWLN